MPDPNPNPLISQIKVGSTTYDIKDTQARNDIEALEAAIAGGVHYIGSCKTELSDGATTSPITIAATPTDKTVTPAAGDLVSENGGNKEFLFDGTAWHEVGDLTGLGDLAWADTASGDVTLPDTYSTTIATSTNATATVAPAESGETTYEPAGQVSAPTVTIDTVSVPNVTTAGTATVVTMEVPANTERLELSVTAGTDTVLGTAITALTGTPEAGETSVDFTTSEPIFSGTAVRLVTGDISVPATFSTTVATTRTDTVIVEPDTE